MQANNNVSFKASKVSVTALPQKVNGKWKQTEATFVKLNPRNKEDMATLKGVELIWRNQNLSGAIREEASICKSPVYGLTLQTKDVKVLDPSEILGLFTTDKIDKTTDVAKIYKIGVRPEFAYTQKTRSRDIKHIGETMIKEFVKILNKNKSVEKLVIESEPEIVKFYKKLDMVESPDSTKLFELNQDKFKEFVR